MAVFSAAAPLSPEQRRRFLEQRCRGDPELRDEVESLLAHHSPQTILPEARAHARGSRPPLVGRWRHRGDPLTAEVSPARRRYAVAGIVVVVCLVAISGWAHTTIRQSLRRSLGERLGTVLAADVHALENWVSLQKAEVEIWAGNPDVRDPIQQLAEIARDPSRPNEELRRAPAYRQLVRLLDPVYDREGVIGISVISRDGICLAQSDPRVVGAAVSAAGGAYLRQLVLGETILARPTKEQIYLVGFPAADREALMAVAAPVFDQHGHMLAGLSFGFRAEHEFNDLLSAAQLGETGETYVFNDRGVLLSDLRDPERLRSLGLLAPGVPPALNVQLLDPGGDLAVGYRPSVSAPRKLTRMVASAVAGEEGVDLDGYRNYRGARVIGAWRWLDQYGFGIGTEVAYEEAYAPLRYVTWASVLLVGLVVLFAAVATFSSLSNARLRRAVDEARQLGQYTLERLIGEGGMGKVYRAQHAMLRRPTAVKLLDGEQADPETVARFEREVQLTSQLTHPNTIQIYDYGRTKGGIFYYAMEYLPGLDLAQLVSLEGAVPPSRTVHILLQAGASLREAHDRGLIHRDIKPANIMVCERGGVYDVVKVLDFGLAKSVVPGGDLDVTRTHRVGGTPLFMAPERLGVAADVDARSDLYSLGVVAFYLLTGRHVFSGATTMEVLHQVMHVVPARPSQVASHAVPPRLDDLVFRCLAKEPDDRPSNVDEVLDDLARVAREQPWRQDDARAWWQQAARDLEEKGPGSDVATQLSQDGDTMRSAPVDHLGRR
jgi:hypothetical protein